MEQEKPHEYRNFFKKPRLLRLLEELKKPRKKRKKKRKKKNKTFWIPSNPEYGKVGDWNGLRMCKLRRKLLLSDRSLAIILGVSAPLICQIENGNRRIQPRMIPQLEELDRLEGQKRWHGFEVKAMRQILGISIKQLAKILGMKTSSLSSIEEGNGSGRNYQDRIQELYDFTKSQFLEEISNNRTKQE